MIRDDSKGTYYFGKVLLINMQRSIIIDDDNVRRKVSDFLKENIIEQEHDILRSAS